MADSYTRDGNVIFRATEDTVEPLFIFKTTEADSYIEQVLSNLISNASGEITYY